MNKELVIKYQTEFNHWLSGGTLRYKYGNHVWRLLAVDDVSMWDCNPTTEPVVFVIDDEWVEFRKALATGSIIEMKHEVSGVWNECHSKQLFRDVWEYRIRPTTPKFVVGDWVTTGTSTMQLTSINFVHGVDHFTLWEPTVDEWCWFWNIDDKQPPLLRKYQTYCAVKNKVKNASGFFDHCEPFVGTLPTECSYD